MCRYREHGPFRLTNIRRIWIPTALIEVHEHDERRSRGALVAVHQRMIPGQPAHQHRRLVEAVRVELVITDARLRGVQR